jgi:CHAP domain-containing protein
VELRAALRLVCTRVRHRRAGECGTAFAAALLLYAIELDQREEDMRSSSARSTSLALLVAAIGCAGPGSSTPPMGDPDAGPSMSPDSGSTNSALDCSASGIAAYADQLASKARTTCTQDGVGVVKHDNYTCMKPAIDAVAPPHAAASFNIVSTLLKTNIQFPFFECTYFVQTVTTGVCNVPISPTSTPWTNYPFACEFINQPAAGYDWIDRATGVVQVGDILLYTSSDNCKNDPGHIMIVVEVKDSKHFRVAEANELTVNGTPSTGMETGVVSNTRIQTLDDPFLASGWFRHHAN